MKKTMALVATLFAFNAAAADQVSCSTIKDPDNRLACYDKKNQSTSTEDPSHATAKQAVLQQLKDPDSAQFRDVFTSPVLNKDGAPLAICGEVNAKNSYGGYTGFQKFYYLPGGQATIVSDSDDC